MKRDPRTDPQAGDEVRLAGTRVFVCSVGAGCVLIHSEKWSEDYNELIGLDEWKKFMPSAKIVRIA